MATVTITLEDMDLNTGAISSSLKVEGSKIDDGQMTAAHITGAYITLLMQQPEFQQKVFAFAEELVANNPGARVANDADGNVLEPAA